MRLYFLHIGVELDPRFSDVPVPRIRKQSGNPLMKSLCRRGVVAEDEARDRSAVIRPEDPAAARMGSFNGPL